MNGDMSVYLIKDNLSVVFGEIYLQRHVALDIPPEQASLSEQLENIREWIEDVGEYGIAYEALVALLEAHEFSLTGNAAIKLLEVGLIMGFKTERPEDKDFDMR